MCTKHRKTIGPPKAITWDHTRQSIKLGVNQANTVMHIHRMGKTDERNSTCGALFPAVTTSFSIELARSLSFFLSLSFLFNIYIYIYYIYLSLILSLSLVFSLFLTLSFLWQISFEQCHMFEGLFSDNLSDNLAINICCTRSPGQAIEPFHAISIFLERK